MRTDNPWVQGTRVMPENAQLLRGILRHEQAMRTEHRWLPYPQARCSFGFGAEQRPLPVGALITLWDRE
ncbi:MAG: hypothetical protein P3B98_11220, partial [Gemmatimonadota bacterium]|nr:hypothetical protein [Gemmatimonadota bacterium]